MCPVLEFCALQASRGLSFGLKGPRKKPKATYRKKQGADENYTLARFDPVLLDVLEEALAGRLSQDEYPYVRWVSEERGAAVVLLALLWSHVMGSLPGAALHLYDTLCVGSIGCALARTVWSLCGLSD